MIRYRYRCIGINPKGVVKVFGWGDTRAMAWAQAESAARQYIRDHDLKSAPLADWDFQVEDRNRKHT
jgi:hypothetical protein